MEAPTDTAWPGLLPADPPVTDARLLDTTEIRRTDLTMAFAEPAVDAVPSPIPFGAPRDDAARDDAAHDDAAHDDAESGSGRLIRPYAMTGGRTKARADLNLESQVQTSTRLNGDATKYRWEAAKILKLAERPMALVELAARAEIPIGVARVVVSDLLEAGAVNVQRNAPVMSYTSLLEKVLDGIRDL